MAREAKKRLELKPVDDHATAEVPRLENEDTAALPDYEEPIVLGPQPASREPSRLELPSRDEIELRSYQPDLDSLLDAENANPDLVEQGWAQGAMRRHSIPWGWFALIGMLIVGVAVWSLSRVQDADRQIHQIREETESLLIKQQREDAEARELIALIENTLRIFFSAATVDTQARYVRHPERVIHLMRRYYADHPLVPNPLRSVRELQPFILDDLARFWFVSVILADGATHHLLLEVDEQGNPLIDWETLVCDQPMPWDQFARERPTGISLDFRVYVEPDVFFSHEFADSSRWLCFRLTALDSEESLFGYLPVDGAEARKMLHWIDELGGGKTSMILRLTIPPNMKSRNGVIIEKLLSHRWIYINPPDS